MMRVRSLSLLGALVLAACAEAPVAPVAELTGGLRNMASLQGNGAAGTSYVLIANGNLPKDLGARVAAAGGTLTSTMPGIAVAVASSDDPSFAANLKGIEAIEDVTLTFEHPRVADDVVELNEGPNVTEQVSVGGTETFRLIQWAPEAVNAPAAWDAGYTGAGVRVAVLDGGIHSAHIDIAPNLDAAHSISFVPGWPFNSDQLGDANGRCLFNMDGTPRHDTFWHGTHVAGIIAAKAQGAGTVGIAPDATIIGVKVLHCGSGSFAWILNGIYYAATPVAEGGAGANVINMSLGAAIAGRGAGIAHLLNAVSRATSYAKKRGVVVVAAAGNNAFDLDHTGNLVFVPAQSVDVISVSATGPLGWATGAPFNLDRPASYTNFGQSAISFAGPGGDFALPGNDLCGIPRLPLPAPPTPPTLVINPCWVFDMVMAPVRGSLASTGSYSWAAGTSMASPAVAGIAALIIGKHPGMSPSQVEAILRKSADDLGKPGNDDFYGKGRVNAGVAVQY